MRKHLIAAVLVLTLAFASCDSPYSVRFQEEHRQFPPGDPKTAALTYPEISERLSYGVYKSLCPGKPLKTLEKAADLMISSGFVKNLAAEKGIDLSTMSATAAAGYVVNVVSDSLGPEALGYGGTKDAMSAAIATALSSNYSCESIEQASRLYYEYGRDDYLTDICGGKNSLKTLLGLFKKAPASVALVATSKENIPSESYVEVALRDAGIGEALRRGEISRREALELLVKKLQQLPLCHEVVEDYEAKLLEMAAHDDPYFFALYDAVLGFKRNCPFEYSGFVLQDAGPGGAVFSDGAEEITLFLPADGDTPNVAEQVAGTNLTLDSSKPLPLKGGDVWVSDAPPPENGIELNFNYLMLIPLALIALYGWKRDKKN